MDFLRLMKVCLVASFVFSCTSAKKTIVDPSKTQLHLLGMYTLPFNLQFKNTTIGGLSGIDYDSSNDLYYIISDDRSAINPARFYKARISLSDKGIDSVQFVDVDFMLQPGGNNYPDAKQDALHAPDPESLRFNPATNELLWTSEGERIVRKADTILSDPSIMLMNTEGRFIDSFILPGNVHMKASQQGPRQNGVFEGSTFVKNKSRLLVSIEEPLYEDGPRAGLNDSAAVLRILEFDVKDRKPLAQYAYRADPVAHPPDPPGSFRINGISEILARNDHQLFVVERSYSTGRRSSTIKIYMAELNGATDVSNYSSLSGVALHFIEKQLVLNMDTLGIYVDNVEGICFGPILPDGHKTIILVSDNNFSSQQETQFFLFEME